MKWIGQHIWDFISRFRSTVYIENLETSSEENVLVVDSDGKVTKNTTLGGADLTYNGNTANGVLTYGGASVIDVESGFTYSGVSGNISLTSATSTQPSINLYNTNSDAEGPYLNFVKQDNGSDNDELGEINWRGDDDGGTPISFTQIVSTIADASNTDEAGKLEIKAATEGTLQQALTAMGSGTSSQVDINLGYGLGSTTVVAGLFQINGNTAYVGGDDINPFTLQRLAHGDGGGGRLVIKGGDATDGQTNQNGGNVQIYGGKPTGSGTFGGITFYDGSVGPTGTDLRTSTIISMLRGDSNTTTEQTWYEKAGASSDDYFKIQVSEHGATKLSTVDAAAHAANLTIDVDGYTKFGAPDSDGGGVEIQTGTAAGVPALLIDNNDVDQVALDVDAENTTANIIDIDAQDLTTGSVIKVDSNSLTSGYILEADIDYVGNVDGAIRRLMLLMIDKSGNVASGETDYTYGNWMRFTDSGTNVGTSYFYGNYVEMVDDNDSGSNIRVANYNKSTGGDPAFTYGIWNVLENGSDDLRFASSANLLDYFTLATGANGETTFTTVENGGGSTAHANFNIDGNIILDAAGDIELNADGGSVSFKDDTATLARISADGYSGNRAFTKTADGTHFEAQGDILYLGGGSTTQGDLCYLKEDGEWGQADADGAATGDDADRDAMGMLAIALGDDPDVDGMLVRGIITMDYDCGDCGNPIYVSTVAGSMTSVPPTTSGDFVRVVGYCLDDTNGQIYFNPDNTWVEIA